MTYAELIENLQKLPKERLQDDVMVYVAREDGYYTLISNYPLYIATDNDVFNAGRAGLVI